MLYEVMRSLLHAPFRPLRGRLPLSAGTVVLLVAVASGSAPAAAQPRARGAETLVVASIPSGDRQPRDLAIVAGTIFTVGAGTLSPGTLLVADGRIAEVRSGTDVPPGYRRIDVPDGVLIPGLVDAHTHHGLRNLPITPDTFEQAESTEVFAPQLRVIDSIDPHAPVFAAVRALGVTTVLVLPGSSGLIGGQGAVLKTREGELEEKLVGDRPVMKMALGMNPKATFGRKGRSPKTRMASAAMLRARLADAEGYGSRRQAGEAELDLELEPLAAVVAGEMPVHIHAARADDVLTALRLMREFGMRGSVGHVYEGHLIASEIAASGVPVVVGPKLDGWSRGTDGDRPSDVAGTLAAAGAQVAIMTDGYVPDLLLQAAYAVRVGMTEEAALRGVTLAPAEILGLGDRIGSLEAGKDADVVVLDRSPFEPGVTVLRTFIQGKEVSGPDVGESKGPGAVGAVPGPTGSSAGAVPTTAGRDAGSAGDVVYVGGGTLWSDGRGFVPEAGVLIRDGRIAAVGTGITPPEEARVIDAGGGMILPGLVEAHTQTGLHGDAVGWDTNEDVRPLTPELRAIDAYYPFAADVAAARRAGITTMLVTPGGKNLIGGTGVLVKTAGATRDELVVRDPAVLKLSLGEEPKRDGEMPRTRMGEMAMLREHLTRARAYERERRGDGSPAPDPELASTAALLRGEIPTLVQVYTTRDIRNALRLADEFGFPLILAYATEAHLMADELARRRIPVLLTSMKGLWYRLEKETFDPDNAALLLEAGVPVALQQGEGNPYGNGELLFNAGYLLRHGVSEEDALRMVTSWPAEILGVSDRVGRLEPGLDGDVLLLSGPAFGLRSRVLHLLVEGETVYERE